MHAGFIFFWLWELVFPTVVFVITAARVFFATRIGPVSGGVLGLIWRDGASCTSCAGFILSNCTGLLYFLSVVFLSVPGASRAQRHFWSQYHQCHNVCGTQLPRLSRRTL